MAKKNKGRVDLNDISTWTLPVIVVFVVAIVGLFIFAAKKLFVDDVVAQKDSVNAQIVKEERQYAKNQEIIALLPHIRKEVAELEVVRDEAKKYLPTEVSMPALIDNVYLAARDNGIVFSKFTPEKDIDKDYYTIKPISLSAEVGYLSMSSFIEQVTTLKRIMNVQSVSFKRDTRRVKGNEKLSEASDEPLKMTAQLRTYIFKETLEDGKK